MPYQRRFVRGLAFIALLTGVLAGPAGRFLLTARAQRMPEPAQEELVDTTIILDYDIPDPSEFRQIVNVYYHVIASSGTPPGGWVVRVSGNNSYGCQGRLEDGQGGCSMLSGASGLDSLVASYFGNGIYRASTSAPELHEGIRADTVTRITWDDPDPSFKGQPLVIRVAVTGLRSAVGRPTGSVVVKAGLRSCTITLQYGVGACQLTFTGVGARKITAAYSGDENYNPSRSRAETHTVVLAATLTPTVPSPIPTPTSTRPTSTPTPTGPGSLPPGPAGKSPTAPPSPTAGPSPTPACLAGAAGSRSSISLDGIPLPDLAVNWMGREPEHLGCYLPGQYWGLRVSISNLGPAPAGRFVVSMDDEEQVVDGMDAGSVAHVLFRHLPGNYVCVNLDTTGSVNESDETNNTLGQWLPVPTQPLPCIAPSLTPSPGP